MTTLSTSIDRPVGALQATGRTRALAAVSGVAGLALAGASVTGTGLVAGSWVRAGLVAAWAMAGLVLAQRGSAGLAAVVAGASAVGGVCAATASSADLAGVHVVAASLIPAVALHLELVMPDGRIGRPGRRNLVVGGYAAAAVVGLFLAAGDRVPSVTVVSACVVAALMVGVSSAHQGYVRSTGLDRQRLQLLGCAVAVAIEVALVVAALRVLVDWPADAAEMAAGATALVPLAIVAGTSARVSTRVDKVLVHTVSATGLTAVVVGVYLVIVIGLGNAPAETERTLLALSMLAAAVAALAYVPARERLAESANRLVYGERLPPDEVLRTWGTRLSRSIPMEELLLQLAESLSKVLVLRRAEIWTGTPGRLELAVSVPDRTAPPLLLGDKERPVVTRAGVTGTAWLEVWLPALLEGRPKAQLRVAPASHSGELLGLLVVERAADGDQFTDEDDRVLTELARQVGLALHNVRLDSALQQSLENLKQANDDLRTSRARIVATGDAERRKIERNLHDGAQQHLVALAVNLRLTKDMLSDDPEGAAEMLDALGDAVKDTIQELRDLAHGIYPPLLMDSGLSEALRAAANRSPLMVSVVADGLGRYPSELEAAVYFCCLEALQNAAKHAPGAAVAITLRQTEGELHFTVSDDGPGFDVAAATAGHGFVNMSDRLGAIGGAVEWRSASGDGATVAGAIPLP
ncbi:MAG: sensor histidine kinase [Acidimicrobiia bacterium]|nr:sensor histidine kinase [Acidimicrobiia bacterium]